MQTRLADFVRDTHDGCAADAILRKCVDCGFCTATCPTHLLLGDELDSPRGRIYLVKQLLEGGEVTARTQTHLDRCLTCRACETICPSGVRYGGLADFSTTTCSNPGPTARCECVSPEPGARRRPRERSRAGPSMRRP